MPWRSAFSWNVKCIEVHAFQTLNNKLSNSEDVRTAVNSAFTACIMPLMVWLVDCNVWSSDLLFLQAAAQPTYGGVVA